MWPQVTSALPDWLLPRGFLLGRSQQVVPAESQAGCHLYPGIAGVTEADVPSNRVWLDVFKLKLKKKYFYLFIWLHWDRGSSILVVAFEILVPQLGVEPFPCSLGVWSLTTGPQGKSLKIFFQSSKWNSSPTLDGGIQRFPLFWLEDEWVLGMRRITRDCREPCPVGYLQVVRREDSQSSRYKGKTICFSSLSLLFVSIGDDGC